MASPVPSPSLALAGDALLPHSTGPYKASRLMPSPTRHAVLEMQVQDLQEVHLISGIWSGPEYSSLTVFIGQVWIWGHLGEMSHATFTMAQACTSSAQDPEPQTGTSSTFPSTCSEPPPQDSDAP